MATDQLRKAAVVMLSMDKSLATQVLNLLPQRERFRLHPPRRPEVRPHPVLQLRRLSNVDDLALRVAVQPGGCSGLIYQLYFDERYLDGDQTTNYGN